MQTLQRATFTTNRIMEFFSEKELQMQIGYARDAWPVALVKELIDNALDACEGGGAFHRRSLSPSSRTRYMYLTTGRACLAPHLNGRLTT